MTQSVASRVAAVVTRPFCLRGGRYNARVSKAEGFGSIAAAARPWSVDLAQGVEERIASYFRELLRWNARVNLTGARDMAELLDDHLPDVFALSSLCPEGAKVVDVGAGGGLPGVPFAVLRPDCGLTMVEPRAKRVAFLHTAVRLADITRTSVVRGRVEDLAPHSYLFAFSKATFAPVDWLAHAGRVLAPEGLAAVLTARAGAERLGAGRLLRSVEYATGSGSPRWAGIYGFT